MSEIAGSLTVSGSDVGQAVMTSGDSGGGSTRGTTTESMESEQSTVLVHQRVMQQVTTVSGTQSMMQESVVQVPQQLTFPIEVDLHAGNDGDESMMHRSGARARAISDKSRDTDLARTRKTIVGAKPRSASAGSQKSQGSAGSYKPPTLPRRSPAITPRGRGSDGSYEYISSPASCSAGTASSPNPFAPKQLQGLQAPPTYSGGVNMAIEQEAEQQPQRQQHERKEKDAELREYTRLREIVSNPDALRHVLTSNFPQYMVVDAQTYNVATQQFKDMGMRTTEAMTAERRALSSEAATHQLALQACAELHHTTEQATYNQEQFELQLCNARSDLHGQFARTEEMSQNLVTYAQEAQHAKDSNAASEQQCDYYRTQAGAMAQQAQALEAQVKNMMVAGQRLEEQDRVHVQQLHEMQQQGQAAVQQGQLALKNQQDQATAAQAQLQVAAQQQLSDKDNEIAQLKALIAQSNQAVARLNEHCQRQEKDRALLSDSKDALEMQLSEGYASYNEVVHHRNLLQKENATLVGQLVEPKPAQPGCSGRSSERGAPSSTSSAPSPFAIQPVIATAAVQVMGVTGMGNQHTEQGDVSSDRTGHFGNSNGSANSANEVPPLAQAVMERAALVSPPRSIAGMSAAKGPGSVQSDGIYADLSGPDMIIRVGEIIRHISLVVATHLRPATTPLTKEDKSTLKLICENADKPLPRFIGREFKRRKGVLTHQPRLNDWRVFADWIKGNFTEYDFIRDTRGLLLAASSSSDVGQSGVMNSWIPNAASAYVKDGIVYRKPSPAREEPYRTPQIQTLASYPGSSAGGYSAPYRDGSDRPPPSGPPSGFSAAGGGSQPGGQGDKPVPHFVGAGAPGGGDDPGGDGGYSSSKKKKKKKKRDPSASGPDDGSSSPNGGDWDSPSESDEEEQTVEKKDVDRLMTELKKANRPQYPQALGVKRWETKIQQVLVTHTPCTDGLELTWFQQVQERSFDQLRDTRLDPRNKGSRSQYRWRGLDTAIRTWLYPGLPSHLRDDIDRREHTSCLAKKAVFLTGRQILSLVYDDVQCDEAKTKSLIHDRLRGLQWQGDSADQIRRFLAQYDQLVTELGPTHAMSDDDFMTILRRASTSWKDPWLISIRDKHNSRYEQWRHLHKHLPQPESTRAYYMRERLEEYIFSRKADRAWDVYQDGVDAEIRAGKGNDSHPRRPAAPTQPTPKEGRPGKKDSKQEPKTSPKQESTQSQRQRSRSAGRDNKRKPDRTAAPAMGPNGEKQVFCYLFNMNKSDPKKYRECPYQNCTFLHEAATREVWDRWKEHPPRSDLLRNPPNYERDGRGSSGEPQKWRQSNNGGKPRRPGRAATPATDNRRPQRERSDKSPARSQRSPSRGSGGSSRPSSRPQSSKGSGRSKGSRKGQSPGRKGGSQTRTPSRGKGNNKDDGPPKVPYYCRDFYAGSCTTSKCQFPHYKADVADRMVSEGKLRKPPDKLSSPKKRN